MIDSIYVAPNVHVIVGAIVLLGSVLALLGTGWAAWKSRRFTTLAQGSLILFQVLLILQVLVGIKLLDQGFGNMQLYIHYLGGLAPLGFCLFLYWLPFKSEARRSWVAFGVAAFSVVFVLMTFAIGSMYVPGGV